MSDINKTDRRLQKNSGETPDLRGVIGDRDPEDVELFGFEIIYTTGEFELPRDALLAKLEDLGFPEWMEPGKVKPHRAFGRAVEKVFEEPDEFEVGGDTMKFVVDDDQSTQYAKHIHLKVWLSADDERVNAENGTWVDHEMGIIRYDSDTQGLAFTDRCDDLDDEVLKAIWFDSAKDQVRSEFDAQQEKHNGGDVNNLTYYLCRNWTDSVKLRDACYFIPADHEWTDRSGQTRSIIDLVDAFRDLYAWVNENYKQKGQKTELYAIEIVDGERQAEMVQAKVRDKLEDEAESMYDRILGRLEDGETIEDIAEQVVDDMGEIEGLAERHSATLKTELSVKRAMQDAMEQLGDSREDYIREVLSELGLSPEQAPEVTA